MADMRSYIDAQKRKLVLYEVALGLYDEYIRKQTLRPGADIRSILIDPSNENFLRVVDDFVQDPSSVLPDTEILTEPETLIHLVTARRNATQVRIRLVKEELNTLGVATLP
ncbi:hypothetical protein B0O80DRAFT_425831 [Mortierella sp. GBAus27b]|nr:hypothetical protein BGX31_002203 [Mortierella sp. GBA43]KAI8355325.1 hypothetical protein B0O80DRAFT_425831 [Mortierella sp. GBAus27b]